MQIGGTKTALFLLVATTAGIGALDHKPGKHTAWDDVRRSLRTRKTTCGALLLAILFDIFNSGNTTTASLGYAALLISLLVIPPPLPAAGWSLMTGNQSKDSYINQTSTRASLPKPSSPLVNSFESTLLTIASGLVLAVITILYALISYTSPSLSFEAVGFSTLSIASATALVYWSLPSALRTQKNTGLALGSVFITIFGIWERYSSGFTWYSLFFTSIALVGAVMVDTRTLVSAPHSHNHSHSGHKHSHDQNHDHHHDHHLHGNHSRLSAFLIARSTPGSIIHSVLIEKDSRRIAYFGV